MAILNMTLFSRDALREGRSMNNRTERKNILRRMLAVLMSMMMLIQPAGVFADDSGLPENVPEEMKKCIGRNL